MGRSKGNITTPKRFSILQRDNFTCQYCGAKAPHAMLEVDHIVPVCEGGTNDDSNLVTACFECNNGKGGMLIDEKNLEMIGICKLQRDILSEINEATQPLDIDVRLFTSIHGLVKRYGRDLVMESVHDFAEMNSSKINDLVEDLVETVTKLMPQEDVRDE